MRYFPLFLDLRERPVLVAGGGAVAARKAELLAAAGARVTLVAPELTPALAAAVAGGRYRQLARAFDAADLAGCALAIAATDDPAVNAQVAAAGRALGIPVNVVDDAGLSSFIVPSIVDRSPLQVAISTGGASPVLARLVRERLETLLDESLGALAQYAERWRSRLKQALPEVGPRRAFMRWMLEGPVAARLRAAREGEADALVEAALAQGSRGAAAPGAAGSVTLVGAGPGDPGLLTLRALRALQEADVVLHDRLVAPAILALARRDARLESVGKHVGGGGSTQREINERLVLLARGGARVVRLKGGDPFVFGRGGEEIDCLRAAGLPYEIVPGITAALACAAHAGIPLTDRRYSRALTLATAHDEDALEAIDWTHCAGRGRTLVLYMGVAKLAQVQERLLAAGIGAQLPVSLVENGSLPGQRVIVATVGTLAQAAHAAAVLAPALLIVGEAAAAATRLQWFGAPPLVHGG